MTREEQAAMFKRGRGIRPEDKNFLQNGPRTDDTARVFLAQPKEDVTASVFKRDAQRYLNGLPPERRKQAEMFF